MEPFDFPVAPHWVTFFQYAGIVAGALIPLSLVFKGVRQWIKRQWLKMRNSRISRKELDRRSQELRDTISASIDQHVSMLVEKIDQTNTQTAKKLSEILATVNQALELQTRVGLLESMLRLSADREDRIGTIYCNEEGEVTWVSRSIAGWFLGSKGDFLGWKWHNFIAPADRAPLREEMKQARHDHREIRMRISMGPFGTDPKPYLLVITPMPDNPPAKAWSGHLTPIGHQPSKERIA